MFKKSAPHFFYVYHEEQTVKFRFNWLTTGREKQPRTTPPSRLSPVRLSPDFQDLSKRVRLSPAFFAYHFQDLTEQDLTEQDLIKLD